MQPPAIKFLMKFMMTWMLIMSVTEIASAGQAFAASTTAAKKSKQGSKNKKKPDAPATPTREPLEGSAKDSSSSGTKQIMANGGLSPSPFIGFGATYGSLNAGRSGVEGSVTYASGKSDTIVAQVTHIGGRYRMGMGNIFYAAAGAGLRIANGSWYVLNQTADQEYKAGTALNAITLDVALGAQVKFGVFCIGADIAGISVPILKMGVKNTLPSADDYDTADAKSQQGKFDKIAAGMNLTIAKVGVGIEF